MKDAQGHGSNGRGGGGDPRFAPHTLTLQEAQRPGIRGQMNRGGRGLYNTDAARTVFGLRQQMGQTGPGHRAGLMQAIKNLWGG